MPLLALLAVAGARPIPLAARTRRISRDNSGATAAGLQTPVDLAGAALLPSTAALLRPLAVRGGSDGMWHLNDDAPPGDRGAADAADDDAGAPDWTELMAHARCASLVYYEASTIVASHERNRYGRAARSVEWRADGSAVARWIGTKRGDATLVVREIPSVGMRYFLRTELRPGLPPVQHLAIKGSDNLQNFKDDVDYAKELCGTCRVRFHRGFKRVADAVTNAHGCAAYAARVPLTRVLTADDPVPLLPTMDVKSHAFGFYRHFGDRLVLLDDDDRDGDGLPDDEAHGDDEADAARRRWLGERAAVLLSPTDATGEPRTKVARLGRWRYAAREDPRLAAARAAKHLDPSPWARLRDLALHQLDENFLLHAHHVSPFAHSMDAYETEVATRRVRSESLPWRAAGAASGR
ncbi:lipase [Aureococcus anophagefferens]|nr:lipase [Aureococcus anophagefferens]